MATLNQPTEAAPVKIKFAASSDFTDKAGIAIRYGFTARHVNRLMEQGMPHLKVGNRRTRFRVSATDAWMEETFGTRNRSGVR